jgi:hypothetical protein
MCVCRLTPPTATCVQRWERLSGERPICSFAQKPLRKNLLLWTRPRKRDELAERTPVLAVSTYELHELRGGMLALFWVRDGLAEELRMCKGVVQVAAMQAGGDPRYSLI